MADVVDINRNQKSYEQGIQDTIALAVGLLHGYARQFGDDTNTRIALMVAAEGIRDIGKARR